MRIKIIRGRNPARGETTLFVFTTDVYSWGSTSVISWFKVTHSPRSINCSWLAADDQNGKTKLTPVSVDTQPRQNKELIGYLRDRAIKSWLPSVFSADVVCRTKGWKGIISDRLADFEEHNTQETLCWLLLRPQSPIGRDLCANIILFITFFVFLNWIFHSKHAGQVCPSKKNNSTTAQQTGGFSYLNFKGPIL